MVRRRPGIALVVSGACCAASDADPERARRGTDEETDWRGALEAAAATTALRAAAASMVGVARLLSIVTCCSFDFLQFLMPVLLNRASR